eukprot:14937752-Alexandrium_andersonii.AAC.1
MAEEVVRALVAAAPVCTQRVLEGGRVESGEGGPVPDLQGLLLPNVLKVPVAQDFRQRILELGQVLLVHRQVLRPGL